MSRQAAFAKGTERRQNDDDPDDPMDVMGNILGVNPQDRPNPTPPVPAPATSSPEWQRLLNQSQYRTGAFEQNQIPNDANTLAQARQPNWAGVNTQRQNLQEAIAGGAISSGLGIAPGPNDANTLATMAGTQAAQTARFRAGAAAQNAIPNDANTLATMRDSRTSATRAPSSTASPEWQTLLSQSRQRTPNDANTLAAMRDSRPNPTLSSAQQQYLEEHAFDRDDPGWSHGTGWSDLFHDVTHITNNVNNALSDAVQGQTNISPEAAQHATDLAVTPSRAVNPDYENNVPNLIARQPREAAEYVWDSTGLGDMWNTGYEVASHPVAAGENVLNGAQWAVAHPKKLWHGAQVAVPAVVRHYRENPDELLKMGVGAAVTTAATLGVGTIANLGVNFLRDAAAARTVVEGVETGVQAGRATGAVEDVVSAGSRAVDDVSRAATSVTDDVARAATGVSDEAVAQTAGTAERATSAATPEWGSNVVAPKPSLGTRTILRANRAIDFTDEQLGRYIGVREDLRNWAHNLPRRALGMEEKDLRLSLGGRVRENIAERIGGDSESSVRQTVAQHISPPRREMPELPEGVTPKMAQRSENIWRRSAIEEAFPNTGPYSHIRQGVEFAENPVGYLADRFLHGGGVEDDWASEYNYLTPGQARGLTRTRRPVSQSVTAAPPDPDTAGFYQRGPMTSAPTMRATAYSDTPVSLGGTTQQGPPQDIGPSSGYQPGRGWKMANSPMYRDEQEPAYG